MDKFIWTKKNSLDKDFCRNCIKKFEKEPDLQQGQVGNNRIDLNIKKSTDFYINPNARPDWKEEDYIFNRSLSKGLREYVKYLKELNEYIDPSYMSNNLTDSGYQIQRTLPGEFYSWHSDYSIRHQGIRVISYLWYLNDVHHDGYTEFYDGTRIQPEEGKLLLFPALWTHEHRGYPPKKETKYVCVGWLYFDCYQLMEDNGYVRKWR